MIRAVTIDAHGVLLLPDPDEIRTILSEFSSEPDDETCWRAHYQMIRILDELTDDDWPFMNRSFAKALGVRRNAQDEAGAILAEKIYLGTSWVPAPGAAAALTRLTAQGYGAAIVSNTVHGDLAQLLSRLEVCSVGGDFVNVAAIVDSQVIGVWKPDPRPFQLALDAMVEIPSNCVHVGDSIHGDVVGAKRIGMTAIHIDPLNLCTDEEHGHSPSFKEFVDDLVP